MWDIDIAWMARNKLLRPGVPSKLCWTRGGKEVARVDFAIVDGGMLLDYKVRSRGEDWQTIRELIPFTWTETNFSGRRQWFCCPGCHRRCRIIYGGVYFRCRLCHRVKYESQYENPVQRLTRKRRKIRARIGNFSPLDEPIMRKPKGMHWRTFRRLYEQDEGLNLLWWGRVTAMMKEDFRKLTGRTL